MIRPSRRVLAVAVTASVALALAACTSDTSKERKKAASCPNAAIVAPASSLTTFLQGRQDDPTGELYTVGMSSLATDCVLDADNGTTDSTLDISFKAHRAAASGQATYRVPYFVAVSLDGKVLTKAMFNVTFTFGEGEQTTAFNDSVASTRINLENGRKPYEYEIVAGMQLTHDQLAYNKKMSRFAP
jgi:hypothetical protein